MLRTTLFKVAVILPLLVFLGACSQDLHRGFTLRKELLQRPSKGPTKILIISDENRSEIESRAKALGLGVSGEAILTIEGTPEALARLEIPESLRNQAIVDEPLEVLSPPPFTEKAERKPILIAKEEFGIPEYLKNHPNHDGRGVIVGAIDDGISPNHEGFQTTTDGKRKIIALENGAAFSSVALKEADLKDPQSDSYIKDMGPYEKLWIGAIDERVLVFGEGADEDGGVDLNGDSQKTSLAVYAIKTSGAIRLCVDSNLNHHPDPKECFGTFQATGEWGFWNESKQLTVTGEFDPATGIARLMPGEGVGDSHAEGLASVVAGHNINGSFDGVAPGAQLLSWDLFAPTSDQTQMTLTAGQLLKAFEWLGSHGVEIVSFADTTFPTNAKTLAFLQKALEAIFSKYNFMVAFAAGNDGPALGMLYEANAFPRLWTLVTGAYVSPRLHELIYGTQGIPMPGRLIWYSSGGPGFDFGQSNDIIAPLSSLVYGNPSDGMKTYGGTSSSAPATAGLAAVILSAIKDEGLTYDAAVLAQSIRLSGQQLLNEPYIQQGNGIPNVERALSIYRDLIKTNQILRVEAKVSNLQGADKTPAKGIQILCSQGVQNTQYSLTLTSQMSPRIPLEKRLETLNVLDIEYSHPWIQGPSQIWASVGATQPVLFVQVDAVKAFAEMPESREIFGEIRLKYKGHLIHVIPVTVIDDKPMIQTEKIVFELAAEQGKRFHFHAPAPGFYRVHLEAEQGSLDTVYLDFVDTQFRQVQELVGPAVRDVIFEAKKPGWHQFAVSRRYGTSSLFKIAMRVEPFRVDWPSDLVTSSGKITFDYTGPEGDFEIAMEPIGELVHEEISTVSAANPTAIIQWPINKSGRLSLDITVDPEPQLLRLRALVQTIILNQKGEALQSLRTSWGSVLALDDSHIGNILKLIYTPFDDLTNPDAETNYRFSLHLTPQDFVSPFGTTMARITPGRNTVQLKLSRKIENSSPGHYRVRVRPLFSPATAQGVSIGEVQVR